MNKMRMQNVNLVILNVKHVPKKHTQDVLYVPQPELKILNQIVHVRTNGMKLPILFVHHVNTNVKHVTVLLVIVLLVRPAE